MVGLLLIFSQNNSFPVCRVSQVSESAGQFDAADAAAVSKRAQGFYPGVEGRLLQYTQFQAMRAWMKVTVKVVVAPGTSATVLDSGSTCATKSMS